MEDKFKKEEQIAIASVLCSLVRADFKKNEGETECLKACLAELGIDTATFTPIPKNELQMKAYRTLKRMDKEKKYTFSRMMMQISRSDGHFGSREQAFVNEILVMCDVPFVHK